MSVAVASKIYCPGKCLRDDRVQFAEDCEYGVDMIGWMDLYSRQAQKERIWWK